MDYVNDEKTLEAFKAEVKDESFSNLRLEYNFITVFLFTGLFYFTKRKE